MRFAVIYARVSSKDQEREGYSIPAQLKLLREYAQRNDFRIVAEFIDVETAKTAGRKQFGEMLKFFSGNPKCNVLIVGKTDRLYRNFRDYVTLEDLGIEIHLPKEGQIIGKDSRSQAKLVHGINVVMARNYIENLREEVRKGMHEKAEQGFYPGRPPFGYRSSGGRGIEIDPEKAPVAQRTFELYASGQHSLSSLRKTHNCLVTAEMKKGKYTYYRCTGFRGKCDLPYFREEELAVRLGGILKGIHVPDGVLAQLEKSLLTDKSAQERAQSQPSERLQQRLASVRTGWIKPVWTSWRARSRKSSGAEKPKSGRLRSSKSRTLFRACSKSDRIAFWTV